MPRLLIAEADSLEWEGFFCGNNTANLERFSVSQCEMKLTKRRSYSVISINEIERQINHVEESIREYIFWWVSEKSPDVFWTTLADVSSLEQCVLQCAKRFICVGADGCSCGSLRSDRSEVRVREWVKTRHKQEMGSNQGYLMLDKEGNANVPEGWTCTTEPTKWRQARDSTLQGCLQACRAANNSFAAFGQSGCRCGDSGEGFSHLAMVHCQNPQANAETRPHSVLFVDVWTQNYQKYSTKPGFQAFWVSQKPSGVRWEAAPGRTVLDDCVSACQDRKGVKLVLVGVDGCECGITTSAGYRPAMAWDARPPASAARGFLLVQMNKASTGYVEPVFEWITKRNNTHKKENEVKEAPTWIRVTVAHSNRKSLRRLSHLSKEERLSQNLERTVGTRGSRGLSQQREHSTIEQRSTTLHGHHERATNHTGATDQKEVSKLARNTTKVAKTNRRKNVMNESERNYVSARDNEITVGSNKRRLVNIETENAARQSAENYKKHTITGEQTAGTIEQFISGEKAHLVRVNSTNTKLLEKSVAANQTHLATEATSHKIRRLHLRQSRVTETKKGKTLSPFLEASGIPFVKKEDNPPNMPAIRPIETVWALLKQKVYEGNWTALSKQQLAGRIRRKIKEVDIEVVRTLLERVPGHLRLVGREGADALI
ncbi:uncharacterized protein LOC122380875 [Amphibalanus amphitrite]|nr:uncharacterized protein LOC122380875 [Amphibalanus amphitrite]